MAITSFKPNSTNAILSNKCSKNSQPNFKGKEEEYAEAFESILRKHAGNTEGIAIKFIQYVGDVAMESREAANGFVARFRDKVPGVTDLAITREIDSSRDYILDQMYPIS